MVSFAGQGRLVVGVVVVVDVVVVVVVVVVVAKITFLNCHFTLFVFVISNDDEMITCNMHNCGNENISKRPREEKRVCSVTRTGVGPAHGGF